MRVDVHDDGDAERRLARTARRMARGALAGRSAVAQPVMPRPVYRDIILPRGATNAEMPVFVVIGNTFEDDTDEIELTGGTAGVDKLVKFAFGAVDTGYTWAADDTLVKYDEAGVYLFGGEVIMGDGGGPDTVTVHAQVYDTGSGFTYRDYCTVPPGFQSGGAPSGLSVQIGFDASFGFELNVDVTPHLVDGSTRTMTLLSATLWGVRIKTVALG